MNPFTKHLFTAITFCFLLIAPFAALRAADAPLPVGDALGKGIVSLSTLALTAPQEYQVVQRKTKDGGSILVAGSLSALHSRLSGVEARIVADGKPGTWQKLEPTFNGPLFNAKFDAPAGGWYQVAVRVSDGEKIVAESAVEHVGIGDIFVVAGQSNSANYGEERQQTKTGRVATFDGRRWGLANDPQPGAGGRSGSFMPPLGDALAARFNVPIGFIACGIGATSVREWLPKGSTFPNPPTLTKRVHQLPNGEWQSDGAAFENFVARTKFLGPQGFRAVLWHQGESDANQKDATRTLSGKLYRESLEKIIRESRLQIGWDAPWFVAQASYHIPGDEASPEIREAQASLWKDGLALEGPDSDALKSEWREHGGKGVHFSGPGLREHAVRWAEKIAPWLESQLK